MVFSSHSSRQIWYFSFHLGSFPKNLLNGVATLSQFQTQGVSLAQQALAQMAGVVPPCK